MKRFLAYGQQSVGMEEERRVRDVLQSDWLSQGPRIVEFEAALTRACAARFAVAVSHGMTALYLACRAAGLGKGDRFITSPISFLATANAATLCGARPVFVDIDPETLNLDPEQVEKALKRFKSVKVLLPTHMGGRVCEMDRLAALCADHGVTVIEDAGQAFGGRWRDAADTWHTVGDCAYSAMSCFSFHPAENITTGEGGAITTNDPEIVARLRLLRNHGMTRDSGAIRSGSQPWAYEMHELSLNGRMTDMQGAMGTVQIEKLPRLKRQRTELVRRYDEAFKDLSGVKPQARPADDDTCWHLMIIRTRGRTALFDYLLREGIRAQVHYIPVHTQPWYRKTFKTRRGDCPVAERYYQKALSLPLYPDLSHEDQEHVIDAVRAFHRAAAHA